MLTLICGIPNAGKTTYSQKFENVIHLDDVQCEKGQSHIMKVCSIVKNTNDDVCVEGIFLVSHQRKNLVRAAGDRHKKCIWLDTSLDECLNRENRGRNSCIIKNSCELFEPPTYDEGWDEIEIIREGE